MNYCDTAEMLWPTNLILWMEEKMFFMFSTDPNKCHTSMTFFSFYSENENCNAKIVTAATI